MPQCCTLFLPLHRQIHPALRAGDPDAVEDWTGGDTTLAQVAYGIGYILAGVYFALFFVLFFFRAAAQRLIIAPQAAKNKADKEESATSSAVEAKVRLLPLSDSMLDEHCRVCASHACRITGTPTCGQALPQ